MRRGREATRLHCIGRLCCHKAAVPRAREEGRSKPAFWIKGPRTQQWLPTQASCSFLGDAFLSAFVATVWVLTVALVAVLL